MTTNDGNEDQNIVTTEKTKDWIAVLCLKAAKLSMRNCQRTESEIRKQQKLIKMSRKNMKELRSRLENLNESRLAIEGALRHFKTPAQSTSDLKKKLLSKMEVLNDKITVMAERTSAVNAQLNRDRVKLKDLHRVKETEQQAWKEIRSVTL